MTTAEAEYRTALDVMLQWVRTWRATGDIRHLDTARICASIAQERFARVEIEHRAGRDFSHLCLFQHQVELEADVPEVVSSVAACRAILMQPIDLTESSRKQKVLSNNDKGERPAWLRLLDS